MVLSQINQPFQADLVFNRSPFKNNLLRETTARKKTKACLLVIFVVFLFIFRFICSSGILRETTARKKTKACLLVIFVVFLFIFRFICSSGILRAHLNRNALLVKGASCTKHERYLLICDIYVSISVELCLD